MGHERVGVLPKTKRWRDIVSLIAPASHSDQIAQLAASTLDNVRDRYERIHRDKGVQAAFAFLVALCSTSEPDKTHLSGVDPGLAQNPSPLSLARKLQGWVEDRSQSEEYATIARRAAAETIALWTRQQTRQGELFPVDNDAALVWSRSANAESFCQVSRIFFSKFTEKYLSYFLGREAGAEVANVHDRQSLNSTLAHHVDEVSRHAFEISKITQSFAAGWYNNYAQESRPSDSELSTFLRVSFGKLQEELLREIR